MKKSLIAAALFGATLAPAAALAQDVPATVAEILAVGATVSGPQGEPVGTIEKIEGGNVVIFTGTNRATLPAASLGRNDTGLIISMTKAQLDSAVQAAEAKVDAAMEGALVADAEIKSSDGVLVGSVQKVDGDNVTVDLVSGQSIVLPKSQLTMKDGGLALFMSQAEFQSAVSAAVAPATATEAAAE